MRKLVLVVGSLAAVVLLALLVHVAKNDDGRVTYEGSYEQLRGEPGGNHGHHRGWGHRQHPGMHGNKHWGKQPRRMKGHHLPKGPGMPSYLGSDNYSCRIAGDAVVLSFAYGAGDRVAPFIDQRDDELIAGVEKLDAVGHPVPSIMLIGRARFPVSRDLTSIKRPDGSDLPCPARKR